MEKSKEVRLVELCSELYQSITFDILNLDVSVLGVDEAKESLYNISRIHDKIIKELKVGGNV